MDKIQELHKSKEIFFNLCNNKVDLNNINFIDSVGATPIAWAIILGNYDLVKYLLANGADMQIRVFPIVYTIITNEWILTSALKVLSLLLPPKVRDILNINRIKKILNILKINSYLTEKGISVKYIPNICYEIIKFDEARIAMIEQWNTQEKFNNKMKLTFWLYPKIASTHNKYMQKFLKDPNVLINIRKEMLAIFENKSNIYSKIHELIPISTTPIEEFFNKQWNEIIIPELLHNIVVVQICNFKD